MDESQRQARLANLQRDMQAFKNILKQLRGEAAKKDIQRWITKTELEIANLRGEAS